MSTSASAPVTPHRLTEHGLVQTAAGVAMRVYFERLDGEPMGFTELYDAFQTEYPGQTAVQFLPKREHFMDQANKYHLLVFPTAPRGFDLFHAQSIAGV